jgi:hypothetical protein
MLSEISYAIRKFNSLPGLLWRVGVKSIINYLCF